MAKQIKNTPLAQVTGGVKSETPTAPVVEETAPIVEKTSTEEKASVLEESAPVVEETAPIVEETSTEEKAPKAEEITDIAVNDTEIVDPEIFEHNGRNYMLAKFVKKLQVNGKVYLREEILTNKEIMSSLIVGNSPFVKRH